MGKRARQLTNDQHLFFRQMQLPSSLAGRVEGLALLLGGLIVRPAVRLLGISVSSENVDLRMLQAILGATVIGLLLAILISLTGPFAYPILLGIIIVAIAWVTWIFQLDYIPRVFVARPPSPPYQPWRASLYALSTPTAAPPPRLTCA